LFEKIGVKKNDIIIGMEMLQEEADEVENEMDSINLKSKDQMFKEVAVRGIGDSFGELALLTKHGVRNARIVARNQLHLGVLCEEAYHRCLSKIEKHR
jgi:hypothetical protein